MFTRLNRIALYCYSVIPLVRGCIPFFSSEGRQKNLFKLTHIDQKDLPLGFLTSVKYFYDASKKIEAASLWRNLFWSRFLRSYGRILTPTIQRRFIAATHLRRQVELLLLLPTNAAPSIGLWYFINGFK